MATHTNIHTIMDRMDQITSQQTMVPWNKLERGQKLQKLNDFALQYGAEKGFTEEQVGRLKESLKDRLNRRQLQKTKDVAYDKTAGTVTRIDCLVCNADGTFSFRNTDSVSPLVSLAPKTTRRLRVEVGTACAANNAS
jgi:hypothetical protein